MNHDEQKLHSVNIAFVIQQIIGKIEKIPKSTKDSPAQKADLEKTKQSDGMYGTTAQNNPVYYKKNMFIFTLTHSGTLTFDQLQFLTRHKTHQQVSLYYTYLTIMTKSIYE